MQYIGLTGGIGSGKSTVARILQIMGYPVYIADTEASCLMNSCEDIRRDLTALFGASVYTPAGDLNKSHLADIIFRNPRALAQVNRIVHPRVIEDFKRWGDQQTTPVVFFESAILFEAQLNACFDFIVCVTAPEALKIQRVIHRDRTTAGKVKERIDNQLAETDKCRQSDFVIYNDPDHMLLEQICTLLKQLETKQR